MNRVLLLIGGIIGLGMFYVVVPAALQSYRRYRGRQATVCPDTGQIVEVEIKAARATLMSLFGQGGVRVKWCSLWPRRKGCAQECVKENWLREKET